MQITQGSAVEVPFFLVYKHDGITARRAAQGVQCRLARPGMSFENLDLSTLREIGDGWYGVVLPAAAAATKGVLIFIAESSDSCQWRDIHQVMEDQ